MPTPDCTKCEDHGTPITYRCHDCQGKQHDHNPAFRDLPANTILVVPCPQCGTINAVRKPKPPVLTGYPITNIPHQEELAL